MKKPLSQTLLVILLLPIVSDLFGQTRETDYNSFYKFPVSIGAEYLGLNPIKDFGFDANITELSGNVRIPLPSIPRLQPNIQVGVIRFDSLDRLQPDKWDHTHYFASIGTGWMNRFSKTFELGGDLSFGLSEAVFPNVDPSGEARGALNFLARIGGRLSLDPSYNLSIDVHPSLTYIKYIGSAENFGLFDGLSLGMGISGHYRFGDDPDAPQAIIRSLKFETDQIPPVFAAMQRYYVDHPIGKVKITNTEKFSLYDVDISFFQKGFMDNPTKSKQIKELHSGETVIVPLFASFNDAVFSKNGVTPLTGEVSAEYIWRNRPVTQVSSVSYDLEDKTALVWDDDRKVGAFITSGDSALRNYASAIKKYSKADEVSGVSQPLQSAIEIYYALTELGIIYQIDPTSPFDAAQDNPVIVDSISLPRDTLVRLTGDCDDLTVVYVSLLETLGIETAYITVPGHIYAAFNSGVPSKDFRKLNIDKKMTLSIDGSLWIPVEITLIGVDTFLKAWRTGISEFAALDDQPEKRSFIKTKDAQEIFSPVGLRETDLGLQYGSKTAIVKNFKRDMNKIVDDVLEGYAAAAEKSKRKRDFNRLGVMAAMFGRPSRAEKAFDTALSLDRNYISPKINLGNLYYIEEDYEGALKNFLGVERTIAEMGKKNSSIYAKVLLNIARTYYELENYDRVSLYYNQVEKLAPDLLKSFSYLNTASDGSRGADAGAFGNILFIEDEE